MSLSHPLENFFHACKAVRQRGIRFLLVYLREAVLFDLRHGTSTSVRVPKQEQAPKGDDVEQSNGVLYVASFTSVVLHAVDSAQKILGVERFADCQFLDLGCGKGKALLVHALRYGSNQRHCSIGIEYDPPLAEQARSNLRRCGISEATVFVVTDSATNVARYLTAETLIVYLYNPFGGATLRKVLTEIKVPHVLVYVDPAERNMLSELGYLICEDVKGEYNADTWLIAVRGIVPKAVTMSSDR